MSPTAEQIHYSTETFNECSRLVHSGRVQAGIQYLMRRWRAIPEALPTRFLHAEFLTLPADTQAGITDLLLVQSRESGITERTAALRQQMREGREQTAGWMPSKPASTSRIENAGTACAGCCPVRAGRPPPLRL